LGFSGGRRKDFGLETGTRLGRGILKTNRRTLSLGREVKTEILVEAFY
jgi:hypothetical protein